MDKGQYLMVLKNGTKFKDYSNFSNNLKIRDHPECQLTHILLDELGSIYHDIKNPLSPNKTHMSKQNIL